MKKEKTMNDKNTFKPFENDSQSITIGNGNGITFENGKDEIVVYGDTTISKNTAPEVLDNLIEILSGIKQQIEQKNNKKLKK